MILSLAAALALSVSSPALTVDVSPVASTSIAKGATRVAMLNVDLQLSCNQKNTVTISEISVTRRGRGDSADILGVYVLQNYLRLSRRQTIERRTGVVIIRTRKIVVAPCETKKLIIAADISPDALSAGEHSFELTSVKALDGSMIVPVTLKQKSATQSSRITPTSAEPPVLVMKPLNQRIVYGPQKIVSRFLLSAGKDSLLIDAITLENDGKASGSDLTSLFIEDASGERLTTVAAQMDGDRVRLEFDPPFLLDSHMQKLLVLKADYRVSIKQTVRFELGEESDIEWHEAGR